MRPNAVSTNQYGVCERRQRRWDSSTYGGDSRGEVSVLRACGWEANNKKKNEGAPNIPPESSGSVGGGRRASTACATGSGTARTTVTVDVGVAVPSAGIGDAAPSPYRCAAARSGRTFALARRSPCFSVRSRACETTNEQLPVYRSADHAPNDRMSCTKSAYTYIASPPFCLSAPCFRRGIIIVIVIVIANTVRTCYTRTGYLTSTASIATISRNPTNE
jgi:hypothetical protein